MKGDLSTVEDFLPHLHNDKGLGERGFSEMYSVNLHLHAALEAAACRCKGIDIMSHFFL